jgi:hypothetical protein
VISSLQSATLELEALTPGWALDVARERKVRLHGPNCEAQGIDFLPAPVEALGGWDASTVVLFQEMARFASLRSASDTAASAFSKFMQRMSISLQRSNADQILSKMGLGV